MHRSRSAAVLVATLLFVYSLNATADSREALDQARTLLGRNDARGAVVVLERALTGEPSQRNAVLELLGQAYGRAADEAEAAGDRTDAEMLRDNFEILKHRPKSTEEKARPVADPAVAKAAAPAPEQRPAPSDGVAAQMLAAPPSSPAPEPSAPAVEPLAPVSAPPIEATPPPAVPAPSPVASAPPVVAEPRPNAPEISVAAADAAFSAKQYAEAGRLYMALAQGKKLPESRRDHLAYCRCAEVVRRINAKPTSAEEWKSIDAEVRQIRDLSPNNWYVEYLRNLASERSPTRRARPSRKVVVRGSAPEESPFDSPRSGPGSPSSTPLALAQAASAPKPTPNTTSPPASAAPARNASPAVVGNWQVRETTNFRILHADPALAEQVAQVVEAAREEQVKRWMGPSGRAGWTPRCDVYVYPNSKSFSRMTGQTEESPGFSTMGMNAGRIVTRRINVRADHPNLVVAVLPHEVTHVVLADLFPTQQIPRWADEGMAVLAEPHSEQRLRAADLDKPLTSGQLFKLNELMVMDYPDGKYWGLYYAQSVSLTRFLVDQGSPAQFIQFVQGAQQRGFEDELKRIYQIDGFEDLQKRWLDYARTKSSDLTAGLAKNSEKSSQ
ncbi:hypothetical protein SAMN05444166_1904 [Singulisphaera sp. GP187]|uniref:peptidase MA family metallohydrolase n=1 Tax=Singulisphaera sp. GP187 TaxID=1882752 RepID=UPI000929B59B|nr:hypothetical protein [Singulisphaera sp. GP187]SIN98345.1 hypothetical protein SAMN05444166_1904 [Singulisphaera sp. GP187]